MIYGANGYSGKIIAREAKSRGLKPILAGRNQNAIADICSELDLESRIFPCESPDQIIPNLQDISLVLHCAGPFQRTFSPMIEACLCTQTHYLDITGEILVFENLLNRSQQFIDAGIVVMPGVGFDVFPTDCLASLLKNELPDANQLRLGFHPHGPIGPGSLLTMLQGTYTSSAVRKDGVIQNIPPGSLARQIIFEDKALPCIAIPWGDVSTAYYSTGIANIEVYIPTTRLKRLLMRLSGYLSEGMMDRLGRLLENWIRSKVKGPSPQVLDSTGANLYGEALNSRGQRVELRYRCPNVYSITVDASLLCVKAVLEGEVQPGAWTPSQALGASSLNQLEGLEEL